MPASGMIVNHNIFAINTQRHLGNNNRSLGVSLERLSSGLRINRAADDASGLSLSEGMRAQIGGMMTATRNAEQAANLIQTAEGALNEVSAMLIRMCELSIQSASSTVNDTNRQAINAEFTQLVAEMDRIAASASYNNTSILRGFGNVVSENIGVSSALVSTATDVTDVTLSGAADGAYLFSDTDPTDNLITLGNGVLSQTIDLGPALDNDSGGGVVATGSTIVANFDRLGIVLNLTGQRNSNGANPALAGYRDGNLDGETLLISGGTGGTLQVGANALAVDRIEINIQDMSATGAKLNLSGVSLSTLQSSQSAITTIDLAIDTVTSVRGDLGAQQNRLTYTINNIGVSVENLQSSESIVRDADIAEEVSNFTRSQILVQSSTALLAQANAVPQNALTLLQ